MNAGISTFLTRLWQLFRARAGRPTYSIARVRELPDRPKPNRLYLLGEGQPWAAALLCPCGCRALLQLSLLPGESPSWRLRVGLRGAPTLDPSIRRLEGCCSHFRLINGGIRWSDSRPS